MKAEKQVAPKGGIHSPPSPAQDGSRAELGSGSALGTDRIPPAEAGTAHSSVLGHCLLQPDQQHPSLGWEVEVTLSHGCPHQHRKKQVRGQESLGPASCPAQGWCQEERAWRKHQGLLGLGRGTSIFKAANSAPFTSTKYTLV